MHDIESRHTPPLAPSEFIGMLRDADALLEFMGREPLDVVSVLATQLTAHANDAGLRRLPMRQATLAASLPHTKTSLSRVRSVD